MAHIKNDEFYLYTGLTPNGNECYDALMHMKASGINFRHLHYGDPAQHEETIRNIKTWFPALDTDITMPFVTYMKINEFTDIDPKLPEIVIGVENIKNTNWQDIANFQG